MLVLVILACGKTPPGPPAPEVAFVEPPAVGNYEVTWDGRHDLLVLPARGEPVEVPRQWQRPVPGAVMPLHHPVLDVPTIAIDAQRQWQQVCPHLRRWRARGEAPSCLHHT